MDVFVAPDYKDFDRLWKRYPCREVVVLFSCTVLALICLGLIAACQEWGTAVNVQAMVFGNMGNDCATGVAFTRNPSNGAKVFAGL